MNIDINELTYFITQVGLSATSFGVTTEDVTAVGMSLNTVFGQRCSPAQVVIPSQPADLQAMCINANCPQASAPVCSQYNKRAGGVGIQPTTATSTPGPQLSALAAQLSTIQTSVASASAMLYTASVITTNISGSSVVLTTSVPKAGGAAAGGLTTSVGTTTGTVSSSTFTSTFTTSGSVSEVVMTIASTVTSGSSTYTTSMAATEDTIVPLTVAAVTSTITSGSVTMTTVFTTTQVATGAAGGGAAATSTHKAAGVPLKVQAGLLAVAGVAAAALA